MSTRSGALTTACRPTLVRKAASRSVYLGSRKESCMSQLHPSFGDGHTEALGRGISLAEAAAGAEHVVCVRVGLDGESPSPRRQARSRRCERRKPPAAPGEAAGVRRETTVVR